MPDYARRFLFLAALAGALAVVLGAFGAHALKARLDEPMLTVWQTAVQYHFWHALALGLIGLLALHLRDACWLMRAGWLMLAGLLLFSGSLYAMALTGTRALGMVTPFGGLAFIAGWLALAWAIRRG
ncbi:hypothetical protein METUNv1_00439 [Methyloversatilis universalis FAM5]|jgi:uncharacterized membrane protein YgdD (TMEM256/DUF423 family)|uniref:DUF423 domain-containing protein n=1 Tax=Methyloversatilis universalis (strain ATCC BAA-1314 / DSM 25237 / JCM 13912 / CCUG 52030 / FAM5) TaxID=1000565 RepID=F5R8G3_METUF|nr:DUF423 domain-containing protein [Methyloversatilis universalis]EGK73266.1 hypothetical protein METUNv1_00439 [Methyloversatilis universalis FAM5]